MSKSSNISEKALSMIQFPVFYEPYGTCILDSKNNKVVDIRGWGRFAYEKNGEELQDKVGEFVAEAINNHNKYKHRIEELENALHKATVIMNPVTACHRHGSPIPNKKLNELSDYQIEMEKILRKG